MNIIELESRYKDVKTTYLPIDDNNGIISTTGEYTRNIINHDNKSIKAVDFEGGPMIQIGDYLTGTNKKVKSIKLCYYIELEE